jgi:hypothetical protein
LGANSGPTSNGAMTFFMIGSTSSLDKLVLATINRLVSPPEVLVNLSPIWGLLIEVKRTVALKVNTYRWYWVLGKIFWLNHRKNQFILSKTQGCRHTFGWGQ